MKIVKWAIIVAIGIVLQTIITAYYVSQKLTYKFTGFNSLLSSVNDGQPITAMVTVTNPTIFNMKIKDLEIIITNKTGLEVLSFLPVKAVFRSGENELPLTFNEGNVLGLLGDYISGSYNDYSITVKGKLGGYLPFKYTSKLMAD